MAAKRGWTGDQWTCLNNLWTKESGWSSRATNASGSAGGIPQALPASKMASAGDDWRTNPATQVGFALHLGTLRKPLWSLASLPKPKLVLNQ
jgi:hypothetical protein